MYYAGREDLNIIKNQTPLIPFRRRLGYSFAGKNHIFALFTQFKLNIDAQIIWCVLWKSR